MLIGAGLVVAFVLLGAGPPWAVWLWIALYFAAMILQVGWTLREKFPVYFKPGIIGTMVGLALSLAIALTIVHGGQLGEILGWGVWAVIGAIPIGMMFWARHRRHQQPAASGE